MTLWIDQRVINQLSTRLSNTKKMKQSIRWILYCASFCMIYFNVVCAQNDTVPVIEMPTKSIAGKVTDHNGTSLEGILVIVHSHDDKLTDSAITDKRGVYQLYNIPPGNYLVWFRYEKNTAAFGNVQIAADSTLILNYRISDLFRRRVVWNNESPEQEAMFFASDGWTGGFGEAAISNPDGRPLKYKGEPVYLSYSSEKLLNSAYERPRSYGGSPAIYVHAKITVEHKSEPNQSIPDAPVGTYAQLSIIELISVKTHFD